MSQLCFYLPPFSGDYAGACSVLYDLNGTVVIHDGHCCSMNYANFDEPRWFAEKRPVYCSSLREVDAVLGSDDKLIAKVRSVMSGHPDSPFVALLGSPAPAVIGADLEGIAAELEAETGVDTFGISTTGFDYYPKGADKVCAALIERYTRPPAKSLADYAAEERVNVAGLIPIDFSDGPNADDVLAAVRAAGCTVNATFAMGMTVDDVRHAADAGLTVAVSATGIAIARQLQRRFGIPYVSAVPFGTDAGTFEARIRAALAAASGEGGAPAPPAAPAAGFGENAAQGRVLVVADQVLGNAIREALNTRHGCTQVTVASFFGIDGSIAREGDIALESEKHLVRVIADGGWCALAGDPLLQNIPGTDELACFAIPHVAISSRLYWHEYLRCMSPEADALLAGMAAAAKDGASKA